MVIICKDPYPNESNYNEYFDLFPYSLSDFQKYSIQAIVDGNHSLVTAHTGSGKSLPAEFAIQFFTKQSKKVIYTSPIKALSNQKYYEFIQKYPHISFGIMTGDIKINPEADVVIMTTEILMNSLFVGPIPDLACVIFDEIHYINDAERGKVWEQSILMLPSNVQMVMLSGTIDSPEKFAAWCENTAGAVAPRTPPADVDLVQDIQAEEDLQIKSSYDGFNDDQQTKLSSRGGLRGSAEGATSAKLAAPPVVVLSSTNSRIVPLVHYGYLCTTESSIKRIKDKAIQKRIQDSTGKLIQLKTENGAFSELGYKEIKSTKELMSDDHQKRQHVMNSLLLQLRDKEMLPAIAFVFSRKQAEIMAGEITVPLLEFDSKVAYTVRKECEQIVRKLPNHAEYLALPEYNRLVSLLEKGIGVHHSGMIPVLREIVEFMILKKYIKLLFATESFAIGLNCPIRTAIFTSLTKFDGSHMRYLLPHEYNQAASRCGRRGLDTIGHVIHCNNLFDMPTSNEYKDILCGKPQTLVSKFRISFPVVLNLMRNNRCALSDFTEFVGKSMCKNEIANTLVGEREYCDKLKNDIQQAERMLTGIQTPIDVCNRYLYLKNFAPTVANKKRKEAEREIFQILSDHKNCMLESDQVRKRNVLLNERESGESYIARLETYIPRNVKTICDILVERKFIEVIEAGNVSEADSSSPRITYQFTTKGRIAAGIAEMHPLVSADCFDSWSRLTSKQIIGLLSCFTDVKIDQDSRMSVPNTNDAVLKRCVSEIIDTFQIYEDLECKQKTDPAYDYTNPIIYDMIDLIMEWCDFTDEVQCKFFIQNKLLCSVGDFTKAILKISAITKELTSVCEQMGMVDFQHKLSQIDGMILKYVATSQSLYL
jgi:superfamily II RNA helicase